MFVKLCNSLGMNFYFCVSHVLLFHVPIRNGCVFPYNTLYRKFQRINAEIRKFGDGVHTNIYRMYFFAIN